MASTGDNIFILPSEVVCQTIGFSLDAGGSAIKLVYRSKKDYMNSKPINPNIPEGKGWLRVVTFQTRKVDEFVDFLEKECDINHNIKNKTISVTGIHTEWYEDALQDRFGISLRRGLEFDFEIVALRLLFKHQPLEELVYPQDEAAKEKGNTTMQFYVGLREMTRHSKEKGGFLEVLDNDIQSGSGVPAEEKQSFGPFLLGQFGSAMAAFKVEEDWSYNAVDCTSLGGRYFMGVSTVICGETKTYAELMKMAEAGDTDEVDMYPSDCMKAKRQDAYGELPKSVCFSFGKPATEQIASFKKEDLVAGWVDSTCAFYAIYAHLMTLAHRVDKFLMLGGIFKHELMRHQFTKHWQSRFLQAKEKHLKLYFLKNGQYLPALGAFLEDVEDMNGE